MMYIIVCGKLRLLPARVISRRVPWADCKELVAGSRETLNQSDCFIASLILIILVRVETCAEEVSKMSSRPNNRGADH